MRLPDPELQADVLPVIEAAHSAARQFDPEAFNALDEDYPASTLLTPLPADTGQLQAVAIADAGYSFLLTGEAQSGKQQALINVLAHSLAHGKQVLLVMPPERLRTTGPYSMVQQLERLGLLPFCLSLPEPGVVTEAEAVAQVLGQLQQSLALPLRRQVVGQQQWSSHAHRLQHLIQSLNTQHQALYQRQPNGLSVWEAVLRLIAHRSWTPVLLPLVPGQLVSRAQVQALQQQSQQLQVALKPLLPEDKTLDLAQHPLRGMAATRYTPDWQRSLHHALLQVQQACDQLLTRAETALPILGLPANTEVLNNLSLAAYAAVNQLLEALRETPQLPRGLVLQAHEASVRQELQALYQHGLQRDLLWARLNGNYRSELTKLVASELKQEWLAIAAYAWPRRAYERNRFFQHLKIYRVDRQPPDESEIPELLEILAQLNAEERWLQSRQDKLLLWLQSDVSGLNGRWTELASPIEWAGRYAAALELVSLHFALPLPQLLAVVLPLLAEERGRLLPDCGIGGSFLRYCDAWQHLDSLRQRVAGLAEAQALILQGDREPEGVLRLQGLAGQWLAGEADWENWCHWQQARGQALAEGLRPFVQAVESGRVPAHALPQFMRYCLCHHWLPQGMATLPEALREFDSAAAEAQQQAFLLADSEFQGLVRQVILSQLYTRLPDDYALIQDGLLPEDPVLAELHQIFQLPPATLNLKMLLRLFPKLIPQLKPCVLATPDAVATWLQPEAGSNLPRAFEQFDLLLVQEAGRIGLESLLPALRHCRQFVFASQPQGVASGSGFAYARQLALPQIVLRNDYRPISPASLYTPPAQGEAAHHAAAVSPLVTAVAQALQQAGWVVHPLQRWLGKVPGVDLAVVDPQQPSRYLLGILCDLPLPERHPLIARERELQRQQILAAQGWPLYRVWTLDWWQDSTTELRNLLDYLYSLLHLPEGTAQPVVDTIAPPIPDKINLAEAFASDLAQFSRGWSATITDMADR
jgi:hypothetical protein